MEGDTVEDFLGEIPGVILQLESNIAAGGFDRAEYLHMVGSEYSGTLAILVQRIERMIERAQTLEHREINGHPIVQVVELHQTMQSLLLHINSLLTHLSSSTFEDATTLPEIVAESQSHDTPQLPVQQSGSRGRPRIAISREMIETFEEMGFTFTQTANILGVTTQTLRHRQREFGMSVGPTRYSEIDDSDLDLVVAQILATTPEIGERFVIGALTSRGLRVQRWRIRSSILRVDPVGRACRRRRTIFRRQYNVRAPNSLWYVL